MSARDSNTSTSSSSKKTEKKKKGPLVKVVVFTIAGKRVWTSGVAAERVDTLTSMGSAVLGLAEQFQEKIRAASFQMGASKMVVLQRSELVLVAVGREANEASLARGLEYAYEAILMALTTKVHKILASSPGFDVGELLGNAGTVLECVNPGSGEWLCGAVKGVRLEPAARAHVGHVLSSARIITAKQFVGASLVFGFLFCGDRLVQLLAPQATPERSLKATDVLLLANFVNSQRQALVAAESSWLPICLPRFENRGYLHAYVSYLDGEMNLSLVLVAADDSAATIGAFRAISNSVKDALDRDGVLAALRDVDQANATAFAANRLAAETSADHFFFARRRPLTAHNNGSGTVGAGTAASSSGGVGNNNNANAAATTASPTTSGEFLSKRNSFTSSEKLAALSSPTNRLGAEFPPARTEDAVAQCVATEATGDDAADDDDDEKKRWLAYANLALRLRCNTTQPHVTLPSSGGSAHDLFEAPLPGALLYEVDGPRTFVALTGPNFELFATFSTFDPVTAVADNVRRLLAMLHKEEAHFFFDPIFFAPNS